MLCAGLALTPAQTEAAYAATELASLPVGSSHVVRAANDADEIVGSVRRSGGHRGFLLKSGSLQEIRGLPGSDYSAALGINDLGQVVGSANTATGMRAFRSRRTTGIVALGTLPGDSSSIALAINHPGQAVGYSSGPTGVRDRHLDPRGRPSRPYRCFPAATRPEAKQSTIAGMSSKSPTPPQGRGRCCGKATPFRISERSPATDRARR